MFTYKIMFHNVFILELNMLPMWNNKFMTNIVFILQVFLVSSLVLVRYKNQSKGNVFIIPDI